MSTQNTNITEKNIKTIHSSFLGWIVFCCFDTLNNTITSFNEVHFDSFHKEIKIEDLFSNAFRDYPELKETYDDVLIIHNNNLSTFVPAPLFDENFMGVICNTIPRF
jgi:hypothetical protein